MGDIAYTKVPDLQIAPARLDDDLPALHTRSKESLADVDFENLDCDLMSFDPDVSLAGDFVSHLDEDYLQFLHGIYDSQSRRGCEGRDACR